MATTSSLFLKNYQTLSGKKTTKPKKLSVGQQFAANLTKFKDITPEPTIDIAKPTNTFGQRLKTAAGKTLQQNIDFFKNIGGKQSAKGFLQDKLKTNIDTTNLTPDIKQKVVQNLITNPPVANQSATLTPTAKYKADMVTDLGLDKIKSIKDKSKVVLKEIAKRTSGTGIAATIKSASPEVTFKQAYETARKSQKENDDTLPEQFVTGLKDTLPQTVLGIALAFVPYVGAGLSTSYWAAISAGSEIEEKGYATPSNVAIDVIGDRILGGMMEKLFKTPAKSLIKIIKKSFVVEGGTEVAQDLLKFANDYRLAKTKEERDAIIQKGKDYFTSGQILVTAGVGGVSGSIVGGVVGTISNQSQKNIDIQNKQNTNISEDKPDDVPPGATPGSVAQPDIVQLRQTTKTRTLITQEIADTNGTVDVNKAISIASLDGVKNTKVGKEIIMKAVQAQQSGEQIKITVPKTGDIQVDLVGVSEDVTQDEVKVPSEKELKTEKVVEPKAETTKSVDELSKSAKNSLLNSEVGIKPGAIERAISEIKKGIKPPVKIRVLEDGTIIIEDGRHHLEAARQLGIKNYPIEDVTAQYNQPTKSSPIKTGTTPRPVDTEIGMVSGEPRYKDSAYPKTFTAKNDIPNMGIKKGESVAIHTYNPSSTYEGKPDSFEIILNKPITKDGFTIKRSGFVKSDFINQNFANSTSPIKTGEVSPISTPQGIKNGDKLIINGKEGNIIQRWDANGSSFARVQDSVTRKVKTINLDETKIDQVIPYVKTQSPLSPESKEVVKKKTISKRVKTAKNITDVKRTLKSIQGELETLKTEAEGLAVVAQEQRAGLNVNDIAKLKRIYARSRTFQEGDIETIRASKHQELVDRVVEDVMMKYPEMSEQEAFDFALALPTKTAETIKLSPEAKGIKDRLKALKDYIDVLQTRQKDLKIDEENTLYDEWKSAMFAEQEATRVIEVPRNQLPVGEGEKKVSRLEARVKDVLDTATQDTVDQLGLTTYEELNKKENIAKASEYVINNPDDAIKVLTGEIEAPKGILRNAIYVAMENMAKGDLNLARKLASITSTRLGQEIGILSEIDKESPVRIMKDVIKIKEEAFKKKYGGRKVAEVRSKMVSEIKTEKVSKSDWNSFINSIQC